jgi:4-carboxymuconolactone decarboxylase
MDDAGTFAELTGALTAAERNADRARLRELVDPMLRFRRGDGTVVTVEEFLDELDDPGYRNDLLEADVECFSVVGDQALVSVMVRFKGLRRGEEREGVFRNLRLYERDGEGVWRVVMWFNRRVADLDMPPGILTPQDRQQDVTRDRGLEAYRRYFGKSRSMESADALAEMTVDHLFANVWTRPGLSRRERSMITVALLTAQGRDHELTSHLKGAHHQGISHATIEEIMIHVAHYAGWAAGHHGLAVARSTPNCDDP